MKNDVNIHQYLRVFNLVTSRGEKTADGYAYDGLNAASDFDGYTVTLSDNQVTLTIFFHNKYEFDYPEKSALQRFLKHLERLDIRA